MQDTTRLVEPASACCHYFWFESRCCRPPTITDHHAIQTFFSFFRTKTSSYERSMTRARSHFPAGDEGLEAETNLPGRPLFLASPKTGRAPQWFSAVLCACFGRWAYVPCLRTFSSSLSLQSPSLYMAFEPLQRDRLYPNGPFIRCFCDRRASLWLWIAQE